MSMNRGDLCGEAQWRGQCTQRGMRAARVLLLAAAALGVAAQDEARWTQIDALLPATLRDSLPNLIRILSDYCQLEDSNKSISPGEYDVVENSSAGLRRYPARVVAARLRALQPARLALYAGGWGNAVGDEAARAVVAALRTNNELVLELDVSGGGDVDQGYVAAAARIGAQTRVLAGIMLAAASAGVAMEHVHAVGFSLGAHAAGAAARAVRRAGGGVLGRLTALDPARPCFARGWTARRWRLTGADADFVQVVHSSAGALGLARRLGHVDVYVRSGEGRGAAGLARAHHAAWRAWAGGLRARRCSDEASLRAGNCNVCQKRVWKNGVADGTATDGTATRLNC